MYARTEWSDPVQSWNVGPGQRRPGAARTHLTTATAVTRVPSLRDAEQELPCSAAPDLFFAERPEEIRQARALCLRCPAREPCLDGALQRAEPWGVWGGELILHGAIIPAKRARGRPRRVSDPAAIENPATTSISGGASIPGAA